MNRNQFKMQFFLYEFIDFLENYQPTFSYSFSLLCVLMQNSQTLSYLMKADNMDYWEPKLSFFAQILYYSNFSNFFSFFQSDNLIISVFFVSQFSFYLSLLGFFLLFFLKKQMHISLKSKKIAVFLQGFCVFLNLFLWVFFVPMLEFYTNLLECSIKSSFCEELYVRILSIFFLISTALLAYLILWANRAHSFIEKNYLRLKFSLLEALILFMRLLLTCLYPIFQEKLPVVIYLLIILIEILLLYNFLMNFSVSDRFLSRFFFAFLVNSLIISLAFLLKNYTNILSQRNLFYTLLITLLFSTKATLKAYEKSQKSLYDAEFFTLKTLSLSLSNFYTFFINKQTEIQASFFFNGIFKGHFAVCKAKNCPLKSADFLAFEKSTHLEQNQLINSLVSRSFVNKIREKKTRNSQEFESLLLNYGSFITYHNMNPIHAFLDLAKVFSLNKIPSLYFKSIVNSLEKSLKLYILDYDHKSKAKVLAETKEMDVFTFSSMHKIKRKLNKAFLSLLKEKMSFWEKYRDGFSSYDELFSAIDRLNTKVLSMQSFLKKSLKNSPQELAYKIFPLKYLCILSCVFMNQLNDGVKIEDEIEKLKKREATLHKDMLNSTSFFEDNVLFLQVSFLDLDGILLEPSKTKKMADFFNYSLEEIKSMKSIKNFMPKIFRDVHKQFVELYVNKPRSSKTQEKAKIETFGLEKSGFIFPLKMYLGHCFDYSNDFVVQSAIIKPRNEQNTLLFDSNGDIQGASKSFWQNLEKEFFGMTVKELNLLSIFCLIPSLQEILTKEKAFEDESLVKVRNKIGFLYIPGNLHEILEMLKMKVKDEEESRSYRSFASSRSQKTNRSKSLKETNPEGLNTNSKNSKFISKFFQTNAHFSQDFRQTIQKKYAQNGLSNYDIMKEMVDYKESKRFKLNFDLLFYTHHISAEQNFKSSTIIIQKLSFSSSKKAAPIINSTFSETSFVEEKDPTLLIDSEIKSGFINMPPVNVTEFRDQPLDTESKNSNENRLFTTEPAAAFENNERLINQKTVNEAKLIVSKVELVKKDEDSIVESSFSQKNITDLGKMAAGKTSNERVFDIQDISSQSSSLSSLKKTYAIYNMMSVIQKNIPHSLYAVLLSKISEIIFITIFCIYLLILSTDYIYSYYIPLEAGLLNFSDLFNAYSLTTVIIFQTDLIKQNYSQIAQSSTYFNIFKLNFNEAYQELQQILEDERIKTNIHHYQDYFKSTEINVTDLIEPKFVNMKLTTFLDKITELAQEIRNLDFEKLDYMESEYFIGNFLAMNGKFEELTEIIWIEFDETNAKIFDSIKVVLILFMVFLFLAKLFEFYQLESFYQHMVRIVNIFLRTNHSDAVTEILATNETKKQISDQSDNFLFLNYAELLLNRKTVKINEEDVDSNKRKLEKSYNESKAKKRYKKAHLSSTKRNSMKPLSRMPRLIFSSISFILIFCFLFFNYFYCSIVNDQIVQLINISNFFQNLYTLPAGIITNKLLIIREKLQHNNFATQINRQQRMIDLYDKLDFNSKDLENTNSQTPKYTLFAMGDINQPEFSKIINGNICEVLLKASEINTAEHLICEGIYNGAFTQGLMSVTDVFVNEIKINYNILNKNNMEINEELLTFLKLETVADDIAATSFINQALKIFYTILNKYYQDAMLKQQENLKIMLIITTFFLGGGLLAIIVGYMRYCKRLYRNITLTLSMIPYDRLINDEQTVYLIKKFGKD